MQKCSSLGRDMEAIYVKYINMLIEHYVFSLCFNSIQTNHTCALYGIKSLMTKKMEKTRNK